MPFLTEIALVLMVAPVLAATAGRRCLTCAFCALGAPRTRAVAQRAEGWRDAGARG